MVLVERGLSPAKTILEEMVGSDACSCSCGGGCRRARLFPRPPAGGPWPTAPSGTQRARGGLVGGATPAPSVPCVSPEVTCWRDGGGCLPDDDCPLWCARRQETCLDRTVGMDFSLLSNVTALELSGLAVATSAILALRQYIAMRHANELPIMVELEQEFRSVEFQRAETMS